MNEASAIARARAGEHQAFADIVEAHQRELGVFLRRRVGNPEVAQDLLQDTFAAAWKALPRTPPGFAVRPWLYKIALNMARQWERRQRLVRWLPLGSRHATLDSPAVEDRDQIERVLARMKREEVEALLLRAVADLTYAEMAKLLQARAEAIRQRVHRARVNFQRIYRETEEAQP